MVISNKVKKKSSQMLIAIFRWCFLSGIIYIIMSPLIAILLKAVMAPKDTLNPLVYLIPENFTMENIKMAWDILDYPRVASQTFIFCLIITVIQVIVCSLAGYGFARYNFKGNKILFALVVLTILVPPQTIMLPLYTQLKNFDVFGIIALITGNPNGINLLGTPYGMILMTIFASGLRSGLYIFIFRQFFKGVPIAMEEAAYIDGLGAFKTFFKIILPNAGPSIITVILFSFVWQFNDTYFSGIYMTNFDFLSIKLSAIAPTMMQVLLINDMNVVLLVVNAGILLVILPIIIMYIFLQKYFIEGVERSGIVG